MAKEKEHPWLFDNKIGLKEKIRFKDRIEYRINGKLSNPFGYAVKYLPDIYSNEEQVLPDDEYWYNGEKMDEMTWKSEVERFTKIKKLQRKIKEKSEN
jgi:hypothetical protein